MAVIRRTNRPLPEPRDLQVFSGAHELDLHRLVFKSVTHQSKSQRCEIKQDIRFSNKNNSKRNIKDQSADKPVLNPNFII